MGGGALFITSRDTDVKCINRLLLHLRNFETEYFDSFKLITASTLPAGTSPTVAPITEFRENAWAGKKVKDVEDWLLEKVDADDFDNHGLGLDLAVIVDEQGMQDETCVIIERIFGDRETSDGHGWLRAFNKTRLPWAETWSMWCNLDIANVGFEEFVDKDIGGGWWKYRSLGCLDSEAALKRRDAALKALEELGYA